MCVAAKGRLQRWAATHLLLLISDFIFKGIGFAELHFVPVRELTSFGCGLDNKKISRKKVFKSL
jgi:hypothetical protein